MIVSFIVASVSRSPRSQVDERVQPTIGVTVRTLVRRRPLVAAPHRGTARPRTTVSWLQCSWARPRPGESEGRRRCRRPLRCDALALVPALPCLDDVGRACEGQQGDDQSDRLPPDIDPHRQSQRIPAPMVRAMAARSVRAQVKRKSLAFTPNSFRSKGRCTPGQATGRSLGDPWLCVPASRRVCRYNRSSEATSVSLVPNARAVDRGFQ